MPPVPIALLSDFGYRDHYAGVMRGVIASIAPAAPVVDITHGIPPQSIAAGAIALRESWRFFPFGTIFVAVVDPGVGTARRPVAIETAAGARFIGPDNGVLWLAADQAGIARAVELRAPRFRLADVSQSFHGRDIFAPAAAHLWLRTPLGAFGPELDDLQQFSLGLVERKGTTLLGRVVYVDGFGNLVTNLGRAEVERLTPSKGAALSVTISGSAPITVRGTYGDVTPGAPVAMFGSFGLLEIAVRDGSAAGFFAAGPGAAVRVQPAHP